MAYGILAGHFQNWKLYMQLCVCIYTFYLWPCIFISHLILMKYEYRMEIFLLPGILFGANFHDSWCLDLPQHNGSVPYQDS